MYITEARDQLQYMQNQKSLSIVKTQLIWHLDEIPKHDITVDTGNLAAHLCESVPLFYEKEGKDK